MQLWTEDIDLHGKSLSLSSESDSSLEEQMELFEVVMTGLNLYGEGLVLATANSSSDLSTL